MPSEKEQLAKAKALIQQRRFEEARDILRWIPNSPSATAWLKKLDQIAPDVEPFPEPKPAKRQSSWWKATKYALVVVIFGGSALYFIFGDMGPDCDQSDDRAKAECIADKEVDDIQQVTVTDERVTITYRLDQAVLSVSEYRRTAHEDFARLMCALREDNLLLKRDFDLTADVPFTDSFGNDGYDVGISAFITWEAAKEMNCKQPSRVNIQAIADEYYENPGIR